MNAKKSLYLLLVLAVLLSGLTACASAPDNVASPAATVGSPTAAPPTPAPPTPAPPTVIPPTPTPLPASLATTPNKEEMGDLILMTRSATGKPLEDEATVLVFALGRLLDVGATEGGHYGATFPSGSYDVVVTYPSTPVVGLLKKDVSVKAGDTTAAVFALPPEGILRVLVRTKDDTVPAESYKVTVSTAARKVGDTWGRDDPASFQLSTGFAYDVTAEYGDQELRATGIQLKEDQAKEVKLVLPFNEANLAVVLRTKNGSVPRKPFGVAVSYKGTAVDGNSSVIEKFVTDPLRDDRLYLVTVGYESQQWQEAGVTLKAGGLTEQSFTLPWDEGVLAILIRAADKVLTDGAAVTILDIAGREIASEGDVTDRYTIVLHTDKEYTVRVQYKDRPEQQRKIQVSADKLTEETFNFTP